MTNGTEDRLRDALAAIREQSIAPPPRDDSEPMLMPDELGARRRPVLLAALAGAAAVIIAVVALSTAGKDAGSDLAATRPGTPLDHDALVARATAECRTFQAAVPAGAPPQDLQELRAWQQDYRDAVADAVRVFAEIRPIEDHDVEVLSLVERNMRLQLGAVDDADKALDRGSVPDAARALDRAISYGSIASFELAKWGAEECDARGVTQATR